MEKPAPVQHPVHELIQRRWSPRAFAQRMVESDVLRSLLEAARWAPSSFNDQPWVYLLATRDQSEDFEQMLDCLVERNRQWARGAPVLMISVGRKSFATNGAPNAVWQHDVGAASENLTLEATARGLFVHQMAGIERDKIRQVYGIPSDYEAVAGVALGYPGDLSNLPAEFHAAERGPRMRKPLDEFVFSKMWGQVAELVQEVAVD